MTLQPAYDYTRELPEEGRLFGGNESARHWSRLIACRSLLQKVGLFEPDLVRCILDVGGGDGYTARTLLNGYEPDLYVCSDVSEAKLLRASARFQRGAGVLGEAERLAFRSGCFDTVLCLEVLEHLENPLTCAREIARVAEKGSRVIISIPVDSFAWYAILRAWHWLKSRLALRSAPREHIQVFTKKQFRNLMASAGFREVSLRSVAFSIPFFGVGDSRTRLGGVLEAALRRLPLDNFGFVRGAWKISVGRQHLILVLEC